MFFSIYDNLVYHHGAGSRPAHDGEVCCRFDVTSKSKIDYDMCAISGLAGLDSTINSLNITKYIAQSTTEYLIVFRLIPGTPLIVQNIVLSLINISSLKFLLTTFIGFTPIIFFSVYIGHKINDIEKIKQLTSKDIL